MSAATCQKIKALILIAMVLATEALDIRNSIVSNGREKHIAEQLTAMMFPSQVQAGQEKGVSTDPHLPPQAMVVISNFVVLAKRIAEQVESMMAKSNLRHGELELTALAKPGHFATPHSQLIARRMPVKPSGVVPFHIDGSKPRCVCNIVCVSSQRHVQLKPRPQPLSATARGSDGASNSTEEASPLESSYPPVPTLRECLSFALPALGIYAAPPLMSLIDAAFIGRTSSIELAALGPASSISDSAALPLLFLSIAATNLIAKSDAKQDIRESRRVTCATLGLGTAGGILIALAVFFLRTFLSAAYCGERAMDAAAILTPHCQSYVGIRSLALPAVVVASVAQAVCIGVKDTATPMVAVLLAAVLNFVGDLILVPGMGMGIAGAAWATTVSQICAAGLLLRVLAKRGLLWSGENIGLKEELSASTEILVGTSNWDTIKTILGFVPFLFVMFVKIGMHNGAAATAAALGGAPAAAHTALFAVAMFCFTLGDTGSSLAQAFLPAFASDDCAPEDDDDKESSRPFFDISAARPTIRQLLKCTFSISATVVGISTAMLTIFARQMTNDGAVIHQMRQALPFMAATLSVHGTAVTLEGLLLAQNNFRGLTVTYSVIAITVAAMLGYVRASGAGLLGVWAVYIWFQLGRITSFCAFSGLFRLPRSLRSKLPVKLETEICKIRPEAW